MALEEGPVYQADLWLVESPRVSIRLGKRFASSGSEVALEEDYVCPLEDWHYRHSRRFRRHCVVFGVFVVVFYRVEMNRAAIVEEGRASTSSLVFESLQGRVGSASLLVQA